MQPDYLAYTTKFDREVRARDLDSVLGPLGPKDKAAVDEAWRELQTGLLPWRTRQHVVAADAAARIRKLLTDEERADAAVTLLLDQSGSMRGQKMLFAAATADIVQEFLYTGLHVRSPGFHDLPVARWALSQPMEVAFQAAVSRPPE